MNGWTVRNNYIAPGSSGFNSVQPLGTGNTLCGNTGNFPASWKAPC